MSRPLSRDTSLDVEERQIEAWRAMSAAEKAELIVAMSGAARDMALAGVRQRYPGASPREHFLRLAILTLGPELARQAYPDIEHLDVK